MVDHNWVSSRQPTDIPEFNRNPLSCSLNKKAVARLSATWVLSAAVGAPWLTLASEMPFPLIMREESGHWHQPTHTRTPRFLFVTTPAPLTSIAYGIDQQCFASGIAYTQMELSGFITRNAITLVGEFQPSAIAESASVDSIAGFVIAHPVRAQVRQNPDTRYRSPSPAFRARHSIDECRRGPAAHPGLQRDLPETAVDNEAAVRLYRKLGYEILRTLPEYYSSHSLDAFQMGKRL